MQILRFIPLALIALPSVVFAAAPRNFNELANVFVSILNSATGALVVLAIVIYFYGVSTNLWKSGDEDREKLRGYLLWGLIIIFIMVSIWGILEILQNTLFSGSPANPATGAIDSGGSFQVPVLSE